jgi:hypothetical protein
MYSTPTALCALVWSKTAYCVESGFSEGQHLHCRIKYARLRCLQRCPPVFVVVLKISSAPRDVRMCVWCCQIERPQT